MSKKVLILGCSFSAGSYKYNPQRKMSLNYSSIGWYDYLLSLRDYEIDVYGMSGFGYLAYSEIIRKLNVSGQLKQYNIVIVQETFENRLHFLKNNFLSSIIEPSWMKNIKNDEHKNERILKIKSYTSSPQKHAVVTFSNTEMFKRFLKEQYDVNVTIPEDAKNIWDKSDTPPHIVIAAKIFIERTLKNANIPMYVFSMWQNIANMYEHDHIWTKSLCNDHLYEKLIINNDAHYVLEEEWPHQTLEGNKVLGKHIDANLTRFIRS